jgi:peptidoglycan/LPS O-acetylase OafA/YrhL
MSSTYLFGLNSLRFVAAFLVVIYHCNDALRQIDSHLYSSKVFLTKGHFAVDYFFILSGFLLTFLSLNEIEKNQKMNIRYFFIRRVLRIFPLYYLSVFIGFFLIGVLYPIVYKDNFLSFSIEEGVFYYLFFLPNYVIVKWQNIGPMYSLWSIGVEEQFYLFFPIIMLGLAKIRSKVFYLFLITFLYTLLYLCIDYGVIRLPSTYKLFIIKTLKFHFLFYGSFLGSVYYYYRSKINSYIGIITKVMGLLLFIISICFLPVGLDHYNFIGGLIFSIVMILFVDQNSQFHIDFKILTYLGTISYGIYIYHPYVSIALRFVMLKVSYFYTIIEKAPFLFYAIVLGMSIIISHYSFRYFEKYFLNLKKKYSF